LYQPVGFAFMEIMRQGVHLDELDVLPEYGGQGIGTALVIKVCAWAAENNYPAVTLTTYMDIPWNARFIENVVLLT
jgi:4-diphosphocytidyl-2-C-methyl-D-erythritol kinase